MDLKARIVEHARILGFDAVGVARADVELEPEHGRYLAFLERGFHGSMGYSAESPEARRTLASEAILPGARSVICLARRYQRTPAEEAGDPPVAQLVARYARGHDYHNHLRKKLRRLAVFVRGLAAGVEARPLCDEEPILERAWASRAGLGFIGKNGLLIVPGKGSFVLLGEVVTTLALPPDTPIAERCGACTRCLDACPTQAFDAPFVLDPRRCVAYLTIEAPLAPRTGSMGEHLFGCDDCQTVCPYNRTEVEPGTRNASFAPLEVFANLDLERLVTLDEAGFLALTTGSPLRRAGRVGLARSACAIAASRLASRDASEGLLMDARRALEAASRHDDALVREDAERARAQLDLGRVDSV